MPAMQRLYESLAGPSFELLAISVDEELAPVEEFRERLGLRFPILLDPDQRAAHAYQTFRFPETRITSYNVCYTKLLRVYIGLIIFFAYFYTAVMINPVDSYNFV